MILVLDNYDSFTYNLVHLLYSLGTEVAVRRNREITPESALALHPEAILLSPGPGRPADAGCMEELIRVSGGTVPILGVCLGHQALGEVFGAKIVPAKNLMHGKISQIAHDGRGVFEGLRQNFNAVRYHSLALEESSLPAELEVAARSEDGEIMGIRHRSLPLAGIQYHPESILTANGRQQLANFLKCVRDFRREA